jgi:flagellar motility protein MotE (MotC chaperone)
MKTTLMVIGGSLVSFVVLMSLALLLLSVKPELFAGVSNVAPQKAPGKKSDSLAVHALHDSSKLVGAKTVSDLLPPNQDSVFIQQLTLKAKVLETTIDSLKRQLEVNKPKLATGLEQDWKATAKLIETMSPEEAGKILKQMDDKEVKQVLTKVKKKQAGKILAMLDPSRAARILR